jgi:hypothetical protein
MAKTPAKKTELRVVPGSLAVTAVQGGLVPLLEPRAGVPEQRKTNYRRQKINEACKQMHYTYNKMVSSV